MSDEKDTRQASAESTPARSLGWTLAWGIAFLFIAYPLSTGPVGKLCIKGGRVPKALEQFYSPLGYLCERSPQLERFFDWYLEKIWRVRY